MERKLRASAQGTHNAGPGFKPCPRLTIDQAVLGEGPLVEGEPGDKGSQSSPLREKVQSRAQTSSAFDLTQRYPPLHSVIEVDSFSSDTEALPIRVAPLGSPEV